MFHTLKLLCIRKTFWQNYSFFLVYRFLYFRSFRHFFGYLVFYLFGPLDLVLWTGSNLSLCFSSIMHFA